MSLEAVSASKSLDGTIAAVVKEISRLHGDIISAARMSLEKAIRIGELLSRVRTSRKGKWLAWIKDNCPFSERTARNYISCFNRRGELKSANVTGLSDAYSLLCAPAVRESAAKKARHRSQSANVAAPANGSNNVESPAESEPAPINASQRRHKSQKQIMKALQKINEHEQQAEKQANDQLSAIIEKLGRKVLSRMVQLRLTSAQTRAGRCHKCKSEHALTIPTMTLMLRTVPK